MLSLMAKETSNSHNTSHTVFVETNLNTHLVMVVSDQDTVAGFKEKVSKEHCGCFPDIGEITVRSLKVRRNGHFYHLLNSILVKSAFDGVKKSWFLHVDATLSEVKCTEKSKKNLRNIHQNLSKDADVRIPSQQTPKIPGLFMEKETHNSVNEIGEGNSIPCSALGRPHGMSTAVAAVGDVNLDSLQDLDMGGASGSKLESRVDASENTSSFVGRKRKRTKNDQPENANEKDMNMKDVVGYSNPLLTAAVMETEDPGNKRRKKAKKNKVADAKNHSHGNSAKDTVPLTSDKEISFDDDLGTKQESILFRTEDRQLSNVCSGHNDRIEEKSMLQNESPKMVPEANNTMSNTRNRDVSAVDAAVSTAVQDPSVKSRKESKKTKAPDSHANSAKNMISLVPDHNISFDGDLGTKNESILFQTENSRISKVSPHENDKSEEKSVLENEDPKIVTMSNTRDRDVSVIDVAVSTKVQDPSVKKRKKSKKTKVSKAERKVSTSGAEHVESSGNASQLISKSHGPSVQDYSGTETNREDDISSRPDDVKVAKLKSLNTRGREFDDKDCQGTGHEDVSLQQAQVVRIQGSTDDVGDKLNRKATKPSVSTSNTIMDTGIIKQAAKTEHPSLLTKGKKEEEKTSKSARRSKLKTDSSASESCDIRPESGSVSRFEAKSVQNQQLSGRVGSPQLPSNAVNFSVGGHRLVNESTDGANDGDEVNFRNYFVPNNVSQVTAPAKELVKKDAQQTKHDKQLKVNKKPEKCNVNSLGTSSDLGKSHDKIENQVHKKKTQSAIPNTFQLQKSNSEPHSNGNTARESLETPLDENDKVKTFPNKASRNKIVDSSEEIKTPHDVQFRSPSGVNVHTSPKVNSEAARTSHVKETGGAVNDSQNQKSLLGVPKKVCSESSTESYEDKGDEKHDSDATRSPSDTSSSSDHSDGESEVNMNSPGSYGRNIMENGGNRSAKSRSVTLKDMDLHSILRSSKSYKKAKLTASQSQPEEDEEDKTSPVPFDLDGQTYSKRA